MWFGVAPAPAPSPRTNTKAWHPPHCTCVRHGGAGASTGRGETATLTAAQPSPRSARAPPTRHAVSLPLPELSGGRKLEVSSPRERRSPPIRKVPTSFASRGVDSQRGAREERSSGRVDTVAQTIVDGFAQRVHRLSRRLSKRLSGEVEGFDRAPKDDRSEQPEREEISTTCAQDNNDAGTIDWPPLAPSRPRSRGVTAAGDPRPTSGVRSILGASDPFNRPLSPASFLSIPVPSKSRRGSRGSQCRTGDRALRNVSTPRNTLKPLHAVATEECIRLTPPMVERAQPANLVGHTSSVGTVLVDDEDFIVSCSIDGSVKVWSRRTFDCLYTLYGHEDTVSSVDLSPCWLVSGSHDTTLRVYESGHGFRFIHTLEGHSGHVTRVLLLSDHLTRHFAISCSDDTTLRLWDVERGHCVAILRAHSSRVTCALVLGSNESILCSGSADASVCFWDLALATSSLQSPCVIAPSNAFRVHKATVQCLLSSTSPHNDATHGAKRADDFVFSCSNDGTIQWFDARSQQHLGCIDSVQSPVYSMALHPTMGFLVCSTGDGRVLIYSKFTDNRGVVAKRELKVAPKWISSLQLLRGKLLACVSEDDLYIVNLERPRIERVLASAHGFLNCVRWLKPEKLVTSGEDNVIKIWSIY